MVLTNKRINEFLVFFQIIVSFLYMQYPYFILFYIFILLIEFIAVDPSKISFKKYGMYLFLKFLIIALLTYFKFLTYELLAITSIYIGVFLFMKRKVLHLFYNKLKEWIISFKMLIHDIFWDYYYKYSQRIIGTIKKYIDLIILVVFFIAGISLYLISEIETVNNFINTLITPENINNTKNIFITIGGALIGAIIITFSFLMFSLQVNIERMPFNLFKQLNSNFQVYFFFIAAFLFSLLIILSSLYIDKNNLKAVLVVVLIISLWIPIGFILVYRRTIENINPLKQLLIIIKSTQSDLNFWNSAIVRKTSNIQEDESFHDTKKLLFFQNNPNWNSKIKQSIFYSISYSKKYSEVGDYEVSQQALNAVVIINAKYIKLKGKTFFTDNILGYNHLSADGVFNDSLESIRQNIQYTITKNDEYFIEQNLKALYNLFYLYVEIDYGKINDSKIHANIATRYLEDAIEECILKKMTDVLMIGIELLGKVVLVNIGKGELIYAGSTVDKIMSLSLPGILIDKKMNPASIVGVEQLSNIIDKLIKSSNYNIRQLIEKVRKNLFYIAKIYLEKEESSLLNFNTPLLASYYSCIYNSFFMDNLLNLSNTLYQAEESEDTKRIINNIKQWSDGLFIEERELFLKAIEKKSVFISDMINRIELISKVLIMLSTLEYCRFSLKEDLIKNAKFIYYIFDWVPKELDAINFVEGYRLSENIYELGVFAYQKDISDVAEDISYLLLNYGIKAWKLETTRTDLLKKTFLGFILIQLKIGKNKEKITRSILDKLPNKGNREDIDLQLDSIYEYHSSDSSIEHDITSELYADIKYCINHVR